MVLDLTLYRPPSNIAPLLIMSHDWLFSAIFRWQYRMLRVATRFGLLTEACLALLLLPVLRRMAVFRLLGLQFEVSVRYHTWLGTAMIFFATLHGAGTFFIWGIKHRIHEEVGTQSVYMFNDQCIFELMLNLVSIIAIFFFNLILNVFVFNWVL